MNTTIQPTLLWVTKEGALQPEPEAMLQLRMVKRGNRVAVEGEGLIKWQSTKVEDMVA